jgi:hypothetical protein
MTAPIDPTRRRSVTCLAAIASPTRGHRGTTGGIAP